MSNEILRKSISDTWSEVCLEVAHYLMQDADCFTVSSGPWTITFDNSKGSEVKK